VKNVQFFQLTAVCHVHVQPAFLNSVEKSYENSIILSDL
jgi:hypothetical protein